MKKIHLKSIEHQYKNGNRCPSIKPNVTEDTLFVEDGKPIGFYLTNIAGKEALKVFNKNSNLNIKDFNSFKDNPKELVELLDIKNNYSPELRKLFNDRYSGNVKYKDALKVNNKIDFVKKFQDPLNVGSNKFDLISVIQFDNKNLEITKPNVGDVDYHPSFAYTIKANIEGINQPDFFYQSSNVTDTYTTYTKTGSTVSVM